MAGMTSSGWAPLVVSGDLRLLATFGDERSKKFPNAPTAKELGLDVLCDKDGKNGLRIAYVAESKTLRVGKVNAPFALKEGEDLCLRVFIDKNLVEVFANDRQAAVAAQKYEPERLGISLFSKGGDAAVKEVRSWRMRSIWP